MGTAENEAFPAGSLYGLCNGYSSGCKNGNMRDPLERTFLQASWKDLVALSYEADPAALRPLVPPPLELDLFEGRAYLSLVGFLFLDTRALGWRLPFSQRFEEVNLRFYVRRRGPEGWRHGVVFLTELVPRWAIAAGARWLFGEPYRTVPMRSTVEPHDPGPSDGPLLRYEWRSGGRWHRLSGRTALPLAPLAPGSREAFLIERHWGYTPRRGGTLEYRVRRPEWRACAASRPVLEADTRALFGPVIGPMLDGAPASGIVADGSPVTVSHGARIEAPAVFP
jgi:uncharacterized protein YqjF (DUF2071 family)